MRPLRAASAVFLAGLIAVLLAPMIPAATPPECRPTPEDLLGPFYEPNAPVRSAVGKGHVLRGTVRSSSECRAIPGTRVELWLTGPHGYDDDHRATVIAGGDGAYRFESEVPRPYERRPPHIHVRVAHPGYWMLVTQHHVARGETEATFDLVLTPAP